MHLPALLQSNNGALGPGHLDTHVPGAEKKCKGNMRTFTHFPDWGKETFKALAHLERPAAHYTAKHAKPKLWLKRGCCRSMREGCACGMQFVVDVTAQAWRSDSKHFSRVAADAHICRVRSPS